MMLPAPRPMCLFVCAALVITGLMSQSAAARFEFQQARRFTVTVSVTADGAPLAGARVVVRNESASQNASAEGVSDATGVATVDVAAAAAVFSVEVSKTGYATVRMSFQSPGTSQANIKLPIALVKEPRAGAPRAQFDTASGLDGEIAALEDRVVRYDAALSSLMRELRLPQGTMADARKEADDDSKTWVAALAWVKAQSSIVASCALISAVTDQFLKAADDADASAKAIEKILAQAEGEASNCTPSSVELVDQSVDHALQIVTAVRRSIDAVEKQYEQLQAATKDVAPFLNERARLTVVFDAMSASAARWANVPASYRPQYYELWKAMRNGLVTDSESLRAAIVAKVAEWRTQNLSADAKARIDHLDGLVGAGKLRGPSEAQFDYDSMLASITQSASRMATYARDGMEALAQMRGCDFSGSDAAVARLTAIEVALTKKLADARGLHAKAEACVARLKIPAPVVAPPAPPNPPPPVVPTPTPGPQPAAETKYGPFSVTPGKWTATGIQLNSGQEFRVEASGTWQYTVGTKAEFGPNGGSAWGWWVLKGKVGGQLMDVGAKGRGVPKQGGPLELGAPATSRMGHGDEPILTGAYIVYVFVAGPSLPPGPPMPPRSEGSFSLEGGCAESGPAILCKVIVHNPPPDASLMYSWTVDGELRQSTGPTLLIQDLFTRGKHEVRVRALDTRSKMGTAVFVMEVYR